MKKVEINAGICGFKTIVEAESEDGQEVVLDVKSDCPHINKLMSRTGNTFDSFEICFAKPFENELYENFEGHAACPVLAGIIKAAEAECSLALPKDSEIKFVD